MQATQLITIMPGAGEFCRLASSNSCTIRKFTGKYVGMQIGDNVVMHHTTDPKSHDVTQPLTEVLRVSSYAIGTLDNIIEAHGNCHQRYLSDTSELKDYILSFYPLAEGEERNDSQLFVAIYF